MRLVSVYSGVIYSSVGFQTRLELIPTSIVATAARPAPAGMPRPAREKSILDAAGLRAAITPPRLDEIAGLADVSKPMLYAYFGSKEGLYVAYVDRTGRELLDRLAGATTPTISRRCACALLEFFEFVEQYRDGWQVLVGERRWARWSRWRCCGGRSPTGSRPCSRHRGNVPDLSVSRPLTPSSAPANRWRTGGWGGHPEVQRHQVAEWVHGSDPRAPRRAPLGLARLSRDHFPGFLVRFVIMDVDELISRHRAARRHRRRRPGRGGRRGEPPSLMDPERERDPQRYGAVQRPTGSGWRRSSA